MCIFLLNTMRGHVPTETHVFQNDPYGPHCPPGGIFVPYEIPPEVLVLNIIFSVYLNHGP